MAGRVRGREHRHLVMTIPSYQINVTRFQGVRRMPLLNWQRLTSSPASRHELHSMELLRVWEPAYRESLEK